MCKLTLRSSLVMAALWNRAGHYIFALWFLSVYVLLLLPFLSSPNLSRTADIQSLHAEIGCLPYFHSTHDVALERI